MIAPEPARACLTFQVNHIEELLLRADKDGQPMSFTVIVPAWKQTQAWSALLRSKYESSNRL